MSFYDDYERKVSVLRLVAPNGLVTFILDIEDL